MKPRIGRTGQDSTRSAFARRRFPATHVRYGTRNCVLWTNLLLLFCLSLVPFIIRWIDEAGVTPLPAAAYGIVLMAAGLAYGQLQRAIIACNGPGSRLATAVGGDLKGKLSVAGYLVAVIVAIFYPWIAIALYVAIALMWFIPDRRIEAPAKR